MIHIIVLNKFQISILATEINCGIPPDKPFGGSTDWNGFDTTFSSNVK